MHTDVSITKSEGDSAVLERVDGGERWRNNPSGSRPNFFGRQHLTFDKGGKDIVRGEGIVRKISLMVRMGSNPHRHGSE